MAKKKPPLKKIRFRRQSYIKSVTTDAVEWVKSNIDYEKRPFDDFAQTQTYLYHVFKLERTSSSMRRIKGEKIGKVATWAVRVDYFNCLDEKLLLLFVLKYGPTIVDNSWFPVKTELY